MIVCRKGETVFYDGADDGVLPDDESGGAIGETDSANVKGGEAAGAEEVGIKGEDSEVGRVSADADGGGVDGEGAADRAGVAGEGGTELKFSAENRRKVEVAPACEGDGAGVAIGDA